MGMNAVYRGPEDMAGRLPIFPLGGALLLPRGQMPLNIFEPRYVAMIDDALASHRLIGMIQPEPAAEGEGGGPANGLFSVGCAGRITQIAETGDGRYILTLTGVARFRLREELSVLTAYRQAEVDYAPFRIDFEPRAGEEEVDRGAVLRALARFVKANDLAVDWKGVEDAPNEALVNALSMMSPFGVREKQALLEAPSLKIRAETLVTLTEIELARVASGSPGGGPDTPLQ